MTKQPRTLSEEEQFSAQELEYVENRAADIKAEDKARYDRVMTEIDKDEREAMKRLREIRIRRAIVTKVGHHG